MVGGHTDEERDRILARSRELLSRPRATYDPNSATARAAQAYVDDVERRKDDEAKMVASRTAITAPPPRERQSAERRTVAVRKEPTRQEVEDLCQRAWHEAPFKSGNDGFADIRGNCVGKSLWLKKHLGGVVVSGWRTDNGRMERHAALIVPIAGRLYVADHGEVVALEDYKFVFQGFYELEH